MDRRAVVLAFVLALACRRDEPVPPAPRPALVPAAAITTDRSHYVMHAGPFGPEVTIRTTFRAPADRAVYLLHCNGALSVGVQQKVGNEWRNAWIAETNGCFSAPILVPAGGSIRRR